MEYFLDYIDSLLNYKINKLKIGLENLKIVIVLVYLYCICLWFRIAGSYRLDSKRKNERN